jgi:hypothetical protein
MFSPQIKRVGRKSSENGEKFSQSGFNGDFEDSGGQVEGDWMGRITALRLEHRSY